MPKYIVRCGTTRVLYALRSVAEFARGARVVARTNRGLEVGEVLCEATPKALESVDSAMTGTIQREMDSSDLTEEKRITALAKKEFGLCKQAAVDLNLNMDVIDIERLFGGERVVVYYISEDRVDFRELVKRLANEFQTRVEMRQIGVRDEAKLLADYGDCGKPVCCNTHLSKMPPVSMRMAKLQKTSLDPNKISGRCGRLKCCLRYEYDTYEELQRELPAIGADVLTRDGRAKVLAHEILSQQLLIQTEDNRRIMIHNDEIVSVQNKRTSSNSSTA